MLCVTRGCGCCIETRPKHPQEDGADHREEITGVGGSFFLTVLQSFAVENTGDGETEIGAKTVDKDGVTSINSLN